MVAIETAQTVVGSSSDGSMPTGEAADVSMRAMGEAARAAASELGRCTAGQRDTALRALASSLIEKSHRYWWLTMRILWRRGLVGWMSMWSSECC